MGKCYLVTGAGGRLGSSFVEILCENNTDDVTELKLVDVTFKEEIKKKLSTACKDSGIKVQWITGSILDEALMRSAAEGVDVALHMAGIIDFSRSVSGDTVWDVNYEGTITSMEACFSANVPYFIFTSSSEAMGPNANCDPMHMGDEETEYPYKPVFMYARSKHEAEEYVSEANGRDLQSKKKFVTCTLRPPGFYGGDDPILEQILRVNGKDRIMRNPTSASALQNRMRVENVAWSHVVAAKQIQVNPASIGGNAYFLGDDTPQRSYMKLCHLFFEPFGYQFAKREPILPYWILRVIAIVMLYSSNLLALFGIKKEVLLSPDSLKLVSTCFTFSHQKFARDFKYQPLVSWDESLVRTREEVKHKIETMQI